MKKMLMLALLVAITPLLFTGCAAKKNPYAECDKLKPTFEEVKAYGKVLNSYELATWKKQDECRERIKAGLR